MENTSIKPESKLTPNEKGSRKNCLLACQRLMELPDSIPHQFKVAIRQNKRYSLATQDTTKYEANFKNKSSINPYEKYFKVEDIDFSPLGLTRLIYRSIYARLNKVNSFTSIELVDEKSKDEKMTAIYELVAKLQLREPIKEILGYDLVKEGEPQDYSELEMYKEIGYKNSIELLLEKHISIINNNNNFTFEIEPIINDSLIISGLCASHLYFDADGSVIEEPIFIDEIKIVGGTKRNYSDATGYVINKKFNIIDFVEMVKNSITIESGNRVLSEDELQNEINKEIDQLRGCADSSGNIDVQLCYWSSWDNHNSKIAFDENENLFIRPHKGNADTKARVHKWYMAYYVKKAEKVYNYGAMPNMIRKKQFGRFREAYSPVTVIRGIERDLTATLSVMHVIRKFEDMATIMWQKLQNEVSRIKPTRVDIDIKSAAATAEMLKSVYPDINVTHIMHALNTGLGLTVSSDIDDNPTSREPFRTSPHPTVSVKSFFEMINMCMDLCFYFSGTPRVDAGVEQNPRISNMQTQMSLSGADKAILDLFENKDELIRLSAEKKMNMVVRLYQSIDKIPNPYAPMFDDYEVDMLADIDFLLSREYNVRIEKGFSDQELAEIKQDILMLNNRYRETGGQQGVSIEEKLQIDMWLKENPKLAIYKIQMLKNKKAKQQEELATKRMQENQAVQMQSAEQAQVGQAQLMQMKAQIEQMVQENKKELLAIKNELEAEKEIKIKAFEKGLNSGDGMGMMGDGGQEDSMWQS